METKSSDKKKVNKHPQLYTIFQPNELIKAKKFQMNRVEKRVYYQILNINHAKTPDQLTYKIPFENVLNSNDFISGNRKANARRISNALQKRIFMFDSTFMKREFGQDAEATIVPFPEITFDDKHFTVSLWPRFKSILTLLRLGFAKGDFETLMSFKYDISDSIYWLVRQHQVFANTWKVGLSDLREMLELGGRYETWDNFKRKLLDNAKVDCKGTWSEFDYKAVKRGKGGEVIAVIFYFKNGPKEEKDIAIGDDYAWEESLLRNGVDAMKIKEIRQRVKINQEGFNETKHITFNWDSDYVRLSVEAMTDELKTARKNTNKKPIRNIGGFLYTGLMGGYWIEYVNSRKEKFKNEVQQNLDFTKEPTVKESKLVLPVSDPGVAMKKVEILTDEAVLEWEELHELSPEKIKPFEEFMNKSGFYLIEGKWVR